MNRLMILCLVLLVAASLAVAHPTVSNPYLVPVEGQGFLFHDNPGYVIYNEGHVNDPSWKWTLMNRLAERRGTWWPEDENTPAGATVSDEDCQDYVVDACEEAGFGTGKAGDASVGDPHANGCQTCMGACTGGCNENGCPHAGVTQCS